MPVKYQKFLERVQNGKIFLWDLVFHYQTHFCCMKKSSNLRSCSSSVLQSLRAQTSQDSKKSWIWLKQPTSYFCLLKSADVSGVCFGSNSLQLTGKLVDKVVAVRWVKKNSEMNNIGWTWLYMRNVLYQQGMVVLMCTGEQVGRSYHHAETGGVGMGYLSFQEEHWNLWTQTHMPQNHRISQIGKDPWRIIKSNSQLLTWH